VIAARRLFADRESLARDLANDVATLLRACIEAKGKAILAVSGGTTPVLFFEKLATTGIPWKSVKITLVDERQVPETNERSNARLVRTHLLKDKAAAARFVPLFENPKAAALPPIDVAILGMGSDGHTASFFPHGDNLSEALDPNTKRRLIEMTAPGAGEPRITFTLPALLEAGTLILHIEGEEKRRVLERALENGPVEEMPIRAILRASQPLTLYWSP
jgi:6-phosphogluconolactonase